MTLNWVALEIMAGVVTDAELANLLTLGQVLDWAQVVGDPGVNTNLRGAFLLATGANEATLPRAFGVVPQAEFDLVINAVTINTGTAELPVATPTTLFQRGALICVGLVCRLMGRRMATIKIAVLFKACGFDFELSSWLYNCSGVIPKQAKSISGKPVTLSS